MAEEKGRSAGAPAPAAHDSGEDPLVARVRGADAPLPDLRDRLKHVLLGLRGEPRQSYLGPVEPPPADGEDPRTGICCSGGGIRSAAYNLGALQSLQDARELEDAKYVAAVSGGSYIAASFCMVAKTGTPAGAGEPAPSRGTGAGGAPQAGHDDSDAGLFDRDHMPFYPSSPEEQYLRNRTSYMAPGGLGKLFLAFRVLLGTLVNIFVIALPLIALGAALAVFVYRPLYPRLAGSAESCPDAGGPVIAACRFAAEIPSGVTTTFLVLGALIGILGVLAMIVRWRAEGMRRFLETWSVRLLLITAGLAVVLVVLPLLLEVLRNYALDVKDASTPEETAKAPGVPAAGAGGLGSLLLAVVLQLRMGMREPVVALNKAKGAAAALRRAPAKLRLALVYVLAAVGGPLLLLAVVLYTASLVLAGADPDAWTWGPFALCAGSLLAFAAVYFIADLNSWSLHSFYRRRLCTAFALKRVRGSDPTAQPEARERDYDRLVPLSESSVEPGPGIDHWPKLLVCAAANVSDPGATPPGRAVTSFVFSPTAIGGPLVGATPTVEYEHTLGKNRRRDITLPAAVAMSGAALSPSMGKMTRKPFTFLMALANVRLGVWVPNPRHVPRWTHRDVLGRKKAGADDPRVATGEKRAPSERRDVRNVPRPYYLFRELLGRNRVDAKFLYVSDGGHYENLGLVELLRRGCTRIFCFDASGGTSFDSLADAIALARSEIGVDIDIDPSELDEGPDHLAERSCVCATFRYRNGVEGRLVYARSVLTADLPWDVRAFHAADPRFPHHSTADQLFTAPKFEAYRRLGQFAGERAQQEMAAAPGDEADAATGSRTGNGVPRVAQPNVPA